jgi:hypothetical protein
MISFGASTPAAIAPRTIADPMFPPPITPS